MRDKDLLKACLKDGWKLDHIKGSHHILIKDGKMISIPVHGKDVKPGLLQSIRKQTGLKL